VSAPAWQFTRADDAAIAAYRNRPRCSWITTAAAIGCTVAEARARWKITQPEKPAAFILKPCHCCKTSFRSESRWNILCSHCRRDGGNMSPLDPGLGSGAFLAPIDGAYRTPTGRARAGLFTIR
jgi:hypothetical protein